MQLLFHRNRKRKYRPLTGYPINYPLNLFTTDSINVRYIMAYLSPSSPAVKYQFVPTQEIKVSHIKAFLLRNRV